MFVLFGDKMKKESMSMILPNIMNDKYININIIAETINQRNQQ